jgi:hypothetical protein
LLLLLRPYRCQPPLLPNPLLLLRLVPPVLL